MSRPPRPRLTRSAYLERARWINRLARLSFATHRPIGDLADRLDVEGIDNCTITIARDLARWVGARGPLAGKSRRDVMLEIAGAWWRYRRLIEAARTSRQAHRRLLALELRRRAHERGVTVTAQRELEVRLGAVSDRVRILAEHADDRGRVFVMLTAA